MPTFSATQSARAESRAAKGKGILSTRFQLDPLAAGRAFIGGRFDFQVSGTPTLEVPGLQNYSFPLSVLFGGSATR
ncbi:MAG: hypothetical protein HC933_11205 [Pleurocapsa sp. SU_196_0]|nr:hypothetical protein [Pleurocapsa sp. SU_196_0]